MKLRTLCSHPIPSVAIHLSAREPFVYVTTQKDSVHIYRYTATTNRISNIPSHSLSLWSTDAQPRNGSCHLLLDIPSPTPTTEEGQQASKTALLVADRSGSLLALLPPSKRTNQHSAPSLFEARLPHPIMRLAGGNGSIRPPWRRNIPPGGNTNGVLISDILACTLDGRVSNISLVDRNAWLLLKFLEGLRKWDLGIGYSTHAAGLLDPAAAEGVIIDPERGVYPQSSLERRRHFAVDGDLLQRFVEAGGLNYLGEVLGKRVREEEPEEVERGNTVENRRRRFVEIVGRVLGRSGEEAMAVEEAVERTVQWIRGVLTPVF